MKEDKLLKTKKIISQIKTFGGKDEN